MRTAVHRYLGKANAQRPAAQPDPNGERERMFRALRNAHNAGDTEAAQRIAKMIQAAPSAPSRSNQNLQALEALEKLGQLRPNERAELAQLRAANPGGQIDPQMAAISQAGLRGDLPPPIPRENALMGGILPSPQQAKRNLIENMFGDNDPNSLNRGEQFAAALNKGGEAMTMGVAGDEAAGMFDALLGRGSATERTQFHRNQENQLQEQSPGLALTAELGGALLGPGKGGAAFINAGRGAAARMGRGALVGAGAGGVYGAMEGENPQDRVQKGLLAAGAGGAAGGALADVGQGFVRAARALRRQPSARAAVSTVEGLKSQAQALYAAAARSGDVIPQNQMAAISNAVRQKISGAGFHPRMHPKVSVVLDELDASSRADGTLMGVDKLRRFAQNAAQSLEPDERRLGAMVIDTMDDAVDSVTGSQHLKDAREIWGRMRRLEAIEEVIEDAANSPNFETALSTKFRAMLRNKKRMRGFSESEKRLIASIAGQKGGVKALRALSQLTNPQSVLGLMTTGGAAYTLGPAPAVALAGAGVGTKAVANAMLRSRAEHLRSTVGQSDQTRAIVEALMRRQNPLAQTAAVPGIGLLSAIENWHKR